MTLKKAELSNNWNGLLKIHLLLPCNLLGISHCWVVSCGSVVVVWLVKWSHYLVVIDSWWVLFLETFLWPLHSFSASLSVIHLIRPFWARKLAKCYCLCVHNKTTYQIWSYYTKAWGFVRGLSGAVVRKSNSGCLILKLLLKALDFLIGLTGELGAPSECSLPTWVENLSATFPFPSLHQSGNSLIFFVSPSDHLTVQRSL